MGRSKGEREGTLPVGKPGRGELDLELNRHPPVFGIGKVAEPHSMPVGPDHSLLLSP